MNYNIAMHTDVGIKKSTNQDSVCVKQAQTDKGNILLAMVCDGMGGLEKGEVASATMISVFSQWFDNELPQLLAYPDPMGEVQYRWERMIKEQNQNIVEYGRLGHIQLGTTLTALLIFEDGKYLIGHVGDTRCYRITDEQLNILTWDQTVVAKEVKDGILTPEQAATDPRQNVLLQCIGASRIVEPDFVRGQAMPNECYMLCSDGFRHIIAPEEIQQNLCPGVSTDEGTMKNQLVKLIELNKERGETDNITAVLVKTL